MMTFIFLLFLFFVILPLCNILWRGWQFSRRWKRATADMREAYRRATGQNQQPEQPAPKKKKIDPEVGEYVVFEEIACNTNIESEEHPDGSTTIKAESQVEDAVWEEIR